MTTAIEGDLTCNEIVEVITDYLEDRMSAADRACFEEHLHWCPPCAEYLAQMQATIRLSKRLTEADLSEPAKLAFLHAFRHRKGGT